MFADELNLYKYQSRGYSNPESKGSFHTSVKTTFAVTIAIII